MIDDGKRNSINTMKGLSCFAMSYSISTIIKHQHENQHTLSSNIVRESAFSIVARCEIKESGILEPKWILYCAM